MVGEPAVRACVRALTAHPLPAKHGCFLLSGDNSPKQMPARFGPYMSRPGVNSGFPGFQLHWVVVGYRSLSRGEDESSKSTVDGCYRWLILARDPMRAGGVVTLACSRLVGTDVSVWRDSLNSLPTPFSRHGCALIPSMRPWLCPPPLCLWSPSGPPQGNDLVPDANY